MKQICPCNFCGTIPKVTEKPSRNYYTEITIKCICGKKVSNAQYVNHVIAAWNRTQNKEKQLSILSYIEATKCK